MVKDIGAIQRLAGRGMGGVAGFYMPRAEGSVAFTPRSSDDESKTALTAQQVLLHEYAHHVTFLTFGHTALPPWFVEGFAKFNATAQAATMFGKLSKLDVELNRYARQSKILAITLPAAELPVGTPAVRALICQGMALLAAAAEAKSKDPAAWQAAHHWFSAANHLDPDDPWPLAMVYQSYRAADVPATANAQTGLLYAHELAPFDPVLGLEAAEVYLRQGKLDAARPALKPVAFSPHGGMTTAVATAVLAAVDSSGASGALAILDRKDPANTDDGVKSKR